MKIYIVPTNDIVEGIEVLLCKVTVIKHEHREKKCAKKMVIVFLNKAMKNCCPHRNFNILNSICDHSAKLKSAPHASDVTTIDGFCRIEQEGMNFHGE